MTVYQGILVNIAITGVFRKSLRTLEFHFKPSLRYNPPGIQWFLASALNKGFVGIVRLCRKFQLDLSGGPSIPHPCKDGESEKLAGETKIKL